MPHSNIHPLVRGNQFQKTEHILVIVKRLPHPHQHHIRNANALVLLDRLDLRQHFGGG